MSVLNKKEGYDVTIVGNGIASKVFLFFFLKSYPHKTVCVIESPLYPSCSIKTTSHVAVAKQVEGTGELGQLVVDSWLAFESFVNSEKPDGVEEGHLYKDSFTESTPHFFISPKIFLNWFDKKNKSKHITYIRSHLEQVQENSDNVTLSFRDKDICSKKVVLACGAGFPYVMIKNLNDEFKKGFVERPGSFWRCSAGNYQADTSWVHTIGKANLIYRKSEHLFLLGGTTNPANELGIDFKTLVEWHLDYKKVHNFLPEFKDGEVDNGTRLRGRKRMPIAGKIQGTENIYALTGLHKNGFSYPFVLAKKCLDEMFGVN
ncbi:MAG: FAD-binding oxidoreductase [Deltaproteobacteria bacterium]|nr:MAG: FAD-binding oxidoreductase [Deltaproteobacteria bacterium]